MKWRKYLSSIYMNINSGVSASDESSIASQLAFIHFPGTPSEHPNRSTGNHQSMGSYLWAKPTFISIAVTNIVFYSIANDDRVQAGKIKQRITLTSLSFPTAVKLQEL